MSETRDWMAMDSRQKAHIWGGKKGMMRALCGFKVEWQRFIFWDEKNTGKCKRCRTISAMSKTG